MNKSNVRTFIFILILIMINLVNAEDSKSTIDIPVKEWLSTGPINLPIPVFNNPKDAPKELLNFDQIEINKLVPKEGEKIKWDETTTLKWESFDAEEDGFLHGSLSKGKVPQLKYFAFYINTDRWVTGHLNISSSQIFQVYLDGESIIKKGKIKEGETESEKKEIKLEMGKHLILVKSIFNPSKDTPWKIKADFQLDKKFEVSDIDITTSEKQKLSLSHIFDTPEIRNVWKRYLNRIIFSYTGGLEFLVM